MHLNTVLMVQYTHVSFSTSFSTLLERVYVSIRITQSNYFCIMQVISLYCYFKATLCCHSCFFFVLFPKLQKRGRETQRQREREMKQEVHFCDSYLWEGRSMEKPWYVPAQHSSQKRKEGERESLFEAQTASFSIFSRNQQITCWTLLDFPPFCRTYGAVLKVADHFFGFAQNGDPEKLQVERLQL